MAEDSKPETFDADYVEKLRNEAAKYRTKVKDLESELETKSDLESRLLASRVENELIRRGVNADPGWVQVEDPANVSEAVETFVEKYPHLVAAGDANANDPRPKRVDGVPPSLPPEPNKANVPGPSPTGAFGGRDLSEIRKDPKARERLTRQYREALGVQAED